MLLINYEYINMNKINEKYIKLYFIGSAIYRLLKCRWLSLLHKYIHWYLMRLNINNKVHFMMAPIHKEFGIMVFTDYHINSIVSLVSPINQILILTY